MGAQPCRRVVHFVDGLLLAYAIRELFLRVADMGGLWVFFVPLEAVLATCALVEWFEWMGASRFGGDLGEACLGSQGDAWDAQSDTALAAFGAFIAMRATLWGNWRYRHDVARDWLRNRELEAGPLGENRLTELREEGRATR